VILIDNSGNRRILKIKGAKRVKHFKVMVDLSQLLGKPFASHWQVKDPKSGELEQITDVRQLTRAYLDEDPFGEDGAPDEEEDGEEEKEVDAGEGVKNRDNRDIVDNNQAQKLGQQEIEAMKAQGLSGAEIIRTLIENSESWSKRTKYSQAKYLRKKLQKYMVTFEVKKPNALELCEAYSSTQPAKIQGLRSDSLALIMQMANIN